jgi:hypothetical protein
MNHMEQPIEPDRRVVECAIIEVLEIAERQGITAADFVRLLDSGMWISDFLTAMNPLKNSVDCDFS